MTTSRLKKTMQKTTMASKKLSAGRSVVRSFMSSPRSAQTVMKVPTLCEMAA